MTRPATNPWKPLAIALAVLLVLVVIYLVLVISGAMELGLSLL